MIQTSGQVAGYFPAGAGAEYTCSSELLLIEGATNLREHVVRV